MLKLLASGTLSIDETEQYKNQVVNFKAANLSSNTAIALPMCANKEAKYLILESTMMQEIVQEKLSMG
jgi:hypothetical protein